MATYKTPGVYVEEISTLPPSVAEVSTAVPAFIGYTEMAKNGDEDLTGKPTRISTLHEYENLFGGAQAAAFTVTVTTDADGIETISASDPADFKFLMHYSVRMYFINGGGPCYIVSAGAYNGAISKDEIGEGLEALKKEDEPTLLLLPDAVGLSVDDYYGLCVASLEQCASLKDRFTIIDVIKNGDNDVATFRDKIGVNDLKYGAAYYPYLKTSLNYSYTDASVTVVYGEEEGTLASLRTTNTGRYNQIKTQLGKKRITLPPSSAVAGIYAKVDRDRGVWKSPANVSLAGVIEPALKITQGEQDNLNIDATAGKSVNAIRSFTGKGTLIWGARTLAGNDNEWRYISVRRLFNMIEESIQKAAAFAVFEANDAMTWLKVKTMITSYLEGLWRQGALAGSAPEQAFFVNVGLGKSMTEQDILEGRMNIEVGVAAVRPAEFIILKFSHKLQEA